jgi:hypothetical protein
MDSPRHELLYRGATRLPRATFHIKAACSCGNWKTESTSRVSFRSAQTSIEGRFRDHAASEVSKLSSVGA